MMARRADPQKKHQIVTAAARVFAGRGYAGTLMAQVAREAGIGKGTIYEYFQSKEDLFFAVFEQIMTEAGQVMMASVNDGSGSAARHLEQLSTILIQTWMVKLDLYALVMEFWSATTHLPSRLRFKRAFQSGYAQFRRLIGALIQRGVDEGEFMSGIRPQEIAAALIGSWDALLLQAWLDSDFDPLAASQEHIRVLLRGLTPSSNKELQ